MPLPPAPWDTEVTQPLAVVCVCDMRLGGCTCAVGKAELEKERQARRERDKRRGDYT